MSDIDLSDKALVDWLTAQKESYQGSCKRAFELYQQFLRRKEGLKEVSGDSILEQHRKNRDKKENGEKYFFDDSMIRFVKWLTNEYESPLTKKPLEYNSAVTSCGNVRGFFAYLRQELEIRGKDKEELAHKQKVKKWHAFRQPELAKMARVADHAEKAGLCLGKDLGIRVGDFVKLLRKPILDAYEDAKEVTEDEAEIFPLEFQILTTKKDVIAIGHIMEETFIALQDYWASIPESKYVFPSNGGHISTDRANDIDRSIDLCSSRIP